MKKLMNPKNAMNPPESFAVQGQANLLRGSLISMAFPGRRSLQFGRLCLVSRCFRKRVRGCCCHHFDDFALLACAYSL